VGAGDSPEEAARRRWELARATQHAGTGARVQRFLEKAKRGEPFTIAAIGGSGECISEVCSWEFLGGVLRVLGARGGEDVRHGGMEGPGAGGRRWPGPAEPPFPVGVPASTRLT
jgi:hypothetical protein